MKTTGRLPSVMMNVLILVLLAVTLGQVSRMRGGVRDTVEELPPPFEVGEHLPNVSLLVASGQSQARFADLFGAKCGVVHFFDSSCNACAGHAPDWSTLDSLEVAGTNVPIAWVATKARDDAAENFLVSNQLPGPLYRIRSDADQKELRVFFVPSSILVRNGEIVSFVGRTPADTLISGKYTGQLPQVCTAS